MVGVLFDLDGVLVDSDKTVFTLTDLVDKHLGDHAFLSLYEAHRVRQGGRINFSVFMQELVSELKRQNVHQISMEMIEQIYLSPQMIQEFVQLIHDMKESGIPYRIFTDGEQREQMTKLQKTGLDVLCEGKISIYEGKMGFFEDEVRQLIEEGADRIMFIEDKVKNLEKALKHPYDITGVWYAPKGGRFSEKYPVFSKDIVRMTSPKDACAYIQHFIETHTKEGAHSNRKERK